MNDPTVIINTPPEGMLPIVIGSLIVVAGWVVSYCLALRAQKKNFENQLIDRARLEITAAIHAHNRILSSLSSMLRTYLSGQQALLDNPRLREIFQKNGVKYNPPIQEQYRDFLKSVDWIYIMEDYEMLFPETVKVRKELVTRNIDFMIEVQRVVEIITHKTVLLETYFDDVSVRILAIVAKADTHTALLGDLSAYLQAKSLNAILSKSRPIPQRIPTEPGHEVIRASKGGNLEIVEFNVDN